MNLSRRALLAGALAATAAGCATGGLVEPGVYDKTPGTTVTLRRAWSDLTFALPNRPRNVRMLSVDGPLLNQLFIASLNEGESLVRPFDRDTPRPVYRADMSDTETVEFVVDCLAAMQYEAPESSALRPQNFGAHPGVRFDIATRTAEGLNISGTALVARVGGKLRVLLFLAPSEHYYGALLPDIEAAFASAQAT